MKVSELRERLEGLDGDVEVCIEGRAGHSSPHRAFWRGRGKCRYAPSPVNPVEMLGHHAQAQEIVLIG